MERLEAEGRLCCHPQLSGLCSEASSSNLGLGAGTVPKVVPTFTIKLFLLSSPTSIKHHRLGFTIAMNTSVWYCPLLRNTRMYLCMNGMGSVIIFLLKER